MQDTVSVEADALTRTIVASEAGRRQRRKAAPARQALHERQEQPAVLKTTTLDAPVIAVTPSEVRSQPDLAPQVARDPEHSEPRPVEKATPVITLTSGGRVQRFRRHLSPAAERRVNELWKARVGMAVVAMLICSTAAVAWQLVHVL